MLKCASECSDILAALTERAWMKHLLLEREEKGHEFICTRFGSPPLSDRKIRVERRLPFMNHGLEIGLISNVYTPSVTCHKLAFWRRPAGVLEHDRKRYDGGR